MVVLKPTDCVGSEICCTEIRLVPSAVIVHLVPSAVIVHFQYVLCCIHFWWRCVLIWDRKGLGV